MIGVCSLMKKTWLVVESVLWKIVNEGHFRFRRLIQEMKPPNKHYDACGVLNITSMLWLRADWERRARGRPDGLQWLFRATGGTGRAASLLPKMVIVGISCCNSAMRP